MHGSTARLKRIAQRISEISQGKSLRRPRKIGDRNVCIWTAVSCEPGVGEGSETMMDDSKYQSNRTEILFLARPSRAPRSIHILLPRCAAFITLLKLICARKLRPGATATVPFEEPRPFSTGGLFSFRGDRVFRRENSSNRIFANFYLEM